MSATSGPVTLLFTDPEVTFGGQVLAAEKFVKAYYDADDAVVGITGSVPIPRTTCRARTRDRRPPRVTSTSKFLLKIVSMTPISPVPLPLPKINLVGNGCQTKTPVVVTMSGKANIGGNSTFKGTFSIPEFGNCQGVEHVLNQLIPGDGNTFTAEARPAP